MGCLKVGVNGYLLLNGLQVFDILRISAAVTPDLPTNSAEEPKISSPPLPEFRSAAGHGFRILAPGDL